MDLPKEWAARLLARYAEPHRHYHTVAHLSAVLATVDALAAWADRSDLVRLAAWYHDAVYDPRRCDNEAASAELARAELATAGLEPADVGRVAELIMVTAGQAAPVGDRDAEVLCDADLAILAAAGPLYDGYVTTVRQEYAHVADDDWRAGRSAVLRGLLDQPQVFRTQPAQAWEQAARANLTRELLALGAPSAGATPPR
ncbi:MAG: metal-dependent phosphohydrolase [Pseudonocardiales bacterium]